MVSLPVPGSPTISTGRRLRAPLAATASAARNSGAAPINCSSDSSGASFSDTGASSPAARRRSALAASASSSRSGATGRTRKSLAPGAHRLDRHRNRVAMAKDDDRQVVALLAQRLDHRRAGLRVPRADQDRLDFAAVRTLEQADRGSPIGGIDRAPAGARGDRRDQAGVRRHRRPAAIGNERALRPSSAP